MREEPRRKIVSLLGPALAGGAYSARAARRHKLMHDVTYRVLRTDGRAKAKVRRWGQVLPKHAIYGRSGGQRWWQRGTNVDKMVVVSNQQAYRGYYVRSVICPGRKALRATCVILECFAILHVCVGAA